MADNTVSYYVAADAGSATYRNLPGWSNPGVIRIAGGFYFSPVFGVVMGYAMSGDSNYNDPVYGPAVISAASFQLAGMAVMPLNSQCDLIGKLGLASNAETYSGASNGDGLDACRPADRRRRAIPRQFTSQRSWIV